MSQKTIIILYNGVETKMEINLEEINNYDLLMDKIHPIITDFNPSTCYNLMAINTSEPYTILDSDNYMKIMQEQISGDDLKLFLNKINIDSNENTDNNNNPPLESNNVVDLGQDGDDDDEDFVIEKEEEKKENENINITNEEKDKNNIDKDSKIDENININKLESAESGEIINNDNDDEDDDNNLYNKTNLMLEKIKQVMGQNLEIYKHSKTVIEPSNIENNNININKINNNINNINNDINNNIEENPSNFIYKENVENFNNILNNNEDNMPKDNINVINDNDNDNSNENQLIRNLIKPDTFKSIKCSICKDNLSGIKYICCVCEKCILCPNCELEHFHPCVKFKTPFLSNLQDVYKFITTFYSFKIPTNNFFSRLFKKEYELSFIPLVDNKICLRPEKEVLLPIKIVNLSKEPIRSSQIDIIPKDNKLVQIYNENKKFTIGPNLAFTLKMKCIAGDTLGKEKITFYGFSEDLSFKNPEILKFNLEFEINKDEEEEKMNKKLEYNENVILYNKEHKKLALEILESLGDFNRTKEHINSVFNILIQSKWNKEKSINRIKSLKK